MWNRSWELALRLTPSLGRRVALISKRLQRAGRQMWRDTTELFQMLDLRPEWVVPARTFRSNIVQTQLFGAQIARPMIE
jgi:hypothetical protein